MAVSPDGRYVYASNLPDGSGISGVSVLDAVSNTVSFYRSISGNVYDVAVGPNGNVYVLSNTSAAVLTIMNATLSATLGTVTVPADIGTSISISPNGKNAIVGGYGGTVSVVDIANSTVTKAVNVGSWVFGTAVSPDNKTAWVNATGLRCCRRRPQHGRRHQHRDPDGHHECRECRRQSRRIQGLYRWIEGRRDQRRVWNCRHHH